MEEIDRKSHEWEKEKETRMGEREIGRETGVRER